MSRFKIGLIVVPLLLSGCCYFTPCHRGTYISGTVTDAVTNQPIKSAAIRLYYYDTQSKPSGCFSLGGPDALPFEFGVSAPGYKPLVIKAVPGSYQSTVILVPSGSSGSSAASNREISREQSNYHGAAPNNSFKPSPLRGLDLCASV